jgi:hypothetical protein
MPIPEEGKQLAEATYMKKKMYYNMRIKTLKRNTTNILRKGREALSARKAQLSKNINALIRMQKSIERTIEMDKISGSVDAGLHAQLKTKHDLLIVAAKNKNTEIAVAEGMLQEMKDQVSCLLLRFPQLLTP